MGTKFKILEKAIIAGVGVGSPQTSEPPEGYGSIVLHIPVNEITGKTPIEIQADLGLPWSDGTDDGFWFKENSPEEA